MSMTMTLTVTSALTILLGTTVSSEGLVNEETLEDSATIPEPYSPYVRILDSPDVLKQRARVGVEYYCEGDSVVVVDLSVMLQDSDEYHVVFSRAWNCTGQGDAGVQRSKVTRLRLPRPLAYRPDYFHRGAWLVAGAKVRAWLVDHVTWTRAQRDGDDVFSSARSRDFHKVKVIPPYSRPYLSPPCVTWYWRLVQRSHTLSDSAVCPYERESVMLLDYPAVFSGMTYGVIRDMRPFKNPELERDRLQRLWAPQLTLEMWVYVLDYCPMSHLSPAASCGLFVHMDRTGQFLTPALLLTREGNLQVDVKTTSGFVAYKTSDALPKHTWTRILFTFDARTWIVHVNYGPDLSEGFWTAYTCAEDIYLNDVEGMMTLGGVDWTLGSFVGYMGRVFYHRRKVLHVSELARVDRFHPMFELHLTSREEKCRNFLAWLDKAVYVYRGYQTYMHEQREDKCPYSIYLFFKSHLNDGRNDVTSCPMKRPFSLSHHRHIHRLLRRAVLRGLLSKNHLEGQLEAYSRDASKEGDMAVVMAISNGLIQNATDLVSERGLKVSGRAVHLLKQSACLGNDDAMFSLAVLLNNGLGTPVDELQSLAFFMLGTLNRHVMSVMALGHRHVMGIDGSPVDKDVAYMYYKQIADQARKEKEEHKDEGIATESIRLVDEVSIRAQTSEVGDLFLWLKNQAEKGVASAQAELGALMYHGAQGLNRNLQNALNVFRVGAENGNVDAMFNYGIMQYRGLGAEANKTKGRKMIKEAAAMRNPNAVSALGWMAMEVDKNMTEAELMFRRAKSMGHVDSGYYLGFMHHFGLIPNSSVNLDRALEEYLWSAVREQMDAGNVYAFMLSRGTPRYKRSINSAVEWARYIAEKNGYLAKPLRHALNAYRDGNYELSLFKYLLLADTGLEVASFNLAYLCEQNQEGVTSYISKECEWRHYNLTTQREFKFVEAYSYIKMGDYHWYGCRGHRNLSLAAKHYAFAALKRDPQALFNLAYMVEDGVKISPAIWLSLRIPSHRQRNNVTLLLELYSRCMESRQSEAFMPCCLAWFRVWCLDVWDQYHLYMKITSLLGIVLACVCTGGLVYSHLLQRRRERDAEAHRLEEQQEDEERRRVDGEDDFEFVQTL